MKSNIRNRKGKNMSDVLKAFKFDGEAVSKEPYGSGHINSTFLVVTDTGKRYILQKINNKNTKFMRVGGGNRFLLA